MVQSTSSFKILSLFVLLTSLQSAPALALQLDWSGQYRTEVNWILNYAMGNTNDGGEALPDPARQYAGGYSVFPAGSKTAIMQPHFMRLKPRVVVNDNIYIKSEWWIGSPTTGVFGNGLPYSMDGRQFYSTQSRGALITAQRFWAEYLSDIGTVQVGRMPLNWGYGLYWSAGDGLWDRYESTGDSIRLVSKFGSFTVIPSYSRMSAGNALGGNCTIVGAGCIAGTGTGGVSDYALGLKYQNVDEDLEAGVQFVKRLAGGAQDPGGAMFGAEAGIPAGMNFNVWDIYGKKKIWKITFGGEAPITSGEIGGMKYSTFALATEAKWDVLDSLDLKLKLGHAPGQASGTSNRFTAFYFNPNYRLGLIMFNYALRNFAGPNTLNNSTADPAIVRSPYDNPIVNSQYMNFAGSFRMGKWAFNSNWLFAKAVQHASAGQTFYNYWDHKTYTNGAGKDQGTFLGWETDLGVTYKWDDAFLFGFDGGVFLPGSFYQFSNTPVDNKTSAVWTLGLKAGVSF
ncbi:MAG: hypothetical protein AAB425_16105 [Bdellovibrionota bacterium]